MRMESPHSTGEDSAAFKTFYEAFSGMQGIYYWITGKDNFFIRGGADKALWSTDNDKWDNFLDEGILIRFDRWNLY